VTPAEKEKSWGARLWSRNAALLLGRPGEIDPAPYAATRFDPV